MDDYLKNLMALGAEYAYRQLSFDIALNYRGLSVKGREKAMAALVGFASR